MAYLTEEVGTFSELVARAALLANGWSAPSKPDTVESYDFTARDPLTNDIKTFQCKTINEREDRRGDLIVYAKKTNGQAYEKSEADYFVGVWNVANGSPRVFMFENREIKEYWASQARASQRWVELPLQFKRESEAV